MNNSFTQETKVFLRGDAASIKSAPPIPHSSSDVSSSNLSSSGSATFWSLSNRHSDFTVPTSNVRDGSPPLDMEVTEDDYDGLGAAPRRPIFNNKVKRKYAAALTAPVMFRQPLETAPPKEVVSSKEEVTTDQRSNGQEVAVGVGVISDEGTSLDADDEPTELHTTSAPLSHITPLSKQDRFVSDLTTDFRDEAMDLLSPLTTATRGAIHRHIARYARHATNNVHETIHFQSLLLGLAFACVWSPSNIMAPNLTDMAQFFGFDNSARDLYLGSYCAIALGVLSVPIGAGLGILADMQSRQKLYVFTTVGGATAAILTGLCHQYWQLLLCRLLNGGFMAGSVPVAFSLLGDLFSTEERNAASSGLTAMMGGGIIFGQVYAGMVGSTMGWSHAFYVSGGVTFVAAFLCAIFVHEPDRGCKERVLQDMIKAGTRYERQLTWKAFWHAMRHNQSNFILLWQGFFSSLPWGIVFVFLNDYLSQEKGFSVPDATYLVLLFGIGCAVGGILGGYIGQRVLAINRSYLPLFMAATTLLGVLPFLPLLNMNITNVHGPLAQSSSFLAGLVASLPSVNVRPCLINVNPPETRGASLTAANMFINLGRGFGPSCITLMGSLFNVSRQFSFNVTLATFWSISAVQLLALARTLPNDQDAMEAELADYANQQMTFPRQPSGDEISLEERMTSFDGTAAFETLDYVRQGFKEFRQEFLSSRFLSCGICNGEDGEDGEEMNGNDESPDDLLRLRDQWREQQRQQSDLTTDSIFPTENSPLVV